MCCSLVVLHSCLQLIDWGISIRIFSHQLNIYLSYELDTAYYKGSKIQSRLLLPRTKIHVIFLSPLLSS